MIDVVSFGEILWDVIGGTAHIGGAPFNLAAHAVRCGLRAAAVSRVGDDALGHAALDAMARHGVERRWTGIDPVHATGTVKVSLQDGQPAYRIRKDAAWDHIRLDARALKALLAARPRAVCFGTLAQRSRLSRGTLVNMLDTLREAVIFYDVNLRQTFWTAPRVARGLARASIVKTNADEARILGGLLFNGACEPAAFSAAVLRRHPAVRVVVVTSGADGCLVRGRGAAPIHCPCARVDVVDTVGAGDAFSAAFLAAWLRGATARKAVEAGNECGAWVAARRGAVPAPEEAAAGGVRGGHSSC
ncbi:MAG: PfkB family carbohydrate kinase [Kiritimatiellia bacterium]|jgi:fructokinase|nr:PfkB family carbohydrate kinase [Kiritimatiellia bacterium]